MFLDDDLSQAVLSDKYDTASPQTLLSAFSLFEHKLVGEHHSANMLMDSEHAHVDVDRVDPISTWTLLLAIADHPQIAIPITRMCWRYDPIIIATDVDNATIVEDIFPQRRFTEDLIHRIQQGHLFHKKQPRINTWSTHKVDSACI